MATGVSINAVTEVIFFKFPKALSPIFATQAGSSSDVAGETL